MLKPEDGETSSHIKKGFSPYNVRRQSTMNYIIHHNKAVMDLPCCQLADEKEDGDPLSFYAEKVSSSKCMVRTTISPKENERLSNRLPGIKTKKEKNKSRVPTKTRTSTPSASSSIISSMPATSFGAKSYNISDQKKKVFEIRRSSYNDSTGEPYNISPIVSKQLSSAKTLPKEIGENHALENETIMDDEKGKLALQVNLYETIDLPPPTMTTSPNLPIFSGRRASRDDKHTTRNINGEKMKSKSLKKLKQSKVRDNLRLANLKGVLNVVPSSIRNDKDDKVKHWFPIPWSQVHCSIQDVVEDEPEEEPETFDRYVKTPSVVQPPLTAYI